MGRTTRMAMLLAAALPTGWAMGGAPALAALDQSGPDAWSRPEAGREALVEPVVFAVRESRLLADAPPPAAPVAAGADAVALAWGGLLMAACGAAMLAAGLRRALRPTRS